MLMDAQQSKPPTFTPPFTAEKTIDQIAAIRPFINHERLIGVGATAVVLREDGHILTVRRQDNGQWFLPAGFSDIGENVAHTAVRETFEQTGLQIELQRILGIYSSPQFHFTYPNNDQVKNVGVVFLALWMAGEAVPDAAEVSEIKWITPGELLQNIDAQFYFLAAQIVIHLQEGVFVL
jgi:ADP-ribose pyrophosphatase YjhB (NUDIX family)